MVTLFAMRFAPCFFKHRVKNEAEVKQNPISKMRWGFLVMRSALERTGMPPQYVEPYRLKPAASLEASDGGTLRSTSRYAPVNFEGYPIGIHPRAGGQCLRAEVCFSMRV
jgi:hypothetical protein